MTNNRNELFNRICKRQVRLAEHTSYGIGGVADYFVMPANVEQLLSVLDASRSYGMERVVFGMGSNVLFPDSPKPGTLYISLKNMTDITLSGSRWFVSSGIPLSMLSLAGLLAGSPEFQFTYLLPGCLGAGIYMNAKYYDEQIGDKIETVYYIDLDDPALSLQTIHAKDCLFAYKQSIFLHKPWIIVGAEFRVPEQAGELAGSLSRLLTRQIAADDNSLSSLFTFYSYFSREIKKLQSQRIRIPEPMKHIEQYRTEKRHFKFRSCGSFFKNNYSAGLSIGAMVDRLGLKGLSCGGAVISPYHGNMILNIRQATASDILALKDTLSEAIELHYGFIPEPEVAIL